MTRIGTAEIAWAERLGARGQAILITVAGTLLGGLPPIFFTLPSLLVVVPGDAAAAIPVTIWPLTGMKVAVGMLVGPWAGLVAGLGSQVLSMALLRIDASGLWTWVVASGLAGLLGGLLPRLFPTPWRVHGPRRLATASVVGIVAMLAAFSLTLLDPALRPGVSMLLALAQYTTLVVPNALLAGIVVPLVVFGVGAVGMDAHADLPPGERLPRPRPGWRPFGAALGVVAVLLVGASVLGVSLPGSSRVRLVGAESAAAAAMPAAAPGPADASPVTRLAELAVPDAPDPSCENEPNARSEAVSTTAAVTLQNDSGRDLLLAWIDYQGARAQPEVVSAGDRGSGEWGLGHVFLLGRPDGTCLVIFRIVGAGPITLRLVP